RTYRRRGPSGAKIEQSCLIQATAQRWGLHVTVSRAVSFGPPQEELRREFDMALRCSALQIASSTARTKPADILTTSDRVLGLGGFDHEWRLCPAGWLTGFAAVELLFAPGEPMEALEVGQALVW